MKRTILAAATISLAAISLATVSLTARAAAEQPVVQSPLSSPNSRVEARLDNLERINVTAYKAPQASEDASGSDAAIDAILQKADEAEHAGSDATP